MNNNNINETIANAPIKEVDEPTGRKEVSVTYNDGDGEITEEGTAIGVYRERMMYLHIDWVNSHRTTIKINDIIDLDESDYK